MERKKRIKNTEAVVRLNQHAMGSSGVRIMLGTSVAVCLTVLALQLWDLKLDGEESY